MAAGSIRTLQRVGFVTSLLLLACLPLPALAEILPIRHYTASDGLPRDAATHIEQDSRGFIWIIASDGISRFDGYRFTTYTTDDGLPDRRVNDLLETRSGVYWLATEAGLCRFNPRGDRLPSSNSAAPMFVVFNPPGGRQATAFNALLEDEKGTIWCATDLGLYRMEVKAGGEAQFHLIDLGKREREGDKNTTVLLKDRKGFLWVGTWGGALYRIASDGRVEHQMGEYGLPRAQPGDDSGAITDLFEDRDGRIWVGTRGLGLHRLVADPAPTRAIVERTYSTKDGLPTLWITSIHQTHDGKLWVATIRGLCLATFKNGADAVTFQVYAAKNGLCDSDIWDVIEDSDGNLWVASRCSTMRVARNGFTGYGSADGFLHAEVNSIFENRDGALTVISRDESRNHRRIINRFDGTRFTRVTPNLPSRISYHGWGGWQTIIQDRTGDWWVPTGRDALFRFPKPERFEQLASSRARAIYTRRDGLPGTEVFRAYEDARGDVWLGITGLGRGLVRWERATDTIHNHSGETVVSGGTDFSGFAEDLRGNLWIGTGEGGGLLRYRDGTFKLFTAEDGVPPGWIVWLYVDRMGRLWIGSQLGGLNRIDDTEADNLKFVRYTTRNGLSSNNVRSITEDLYGRIYVGTGHGVDRVDLVTGNVKHFTAAEGLPRGVIEHAYRDRHGALWFGSTFGLSRLIPEQRDSIAPPAIYITGLRVTAVPQRVSELGEVNLPLLELAAQQNQVSIDYVGLGATLGEELRYQYRLAGTGTDWSVPTAERTISYANLAPGSYSFAVRAINADGQVSQSPATFAFTILSPIWQRWWFLALCVFTLSLAVYAVYRYRIARLLAVANMRTRIATDLHDDIGADLTKIALLSEVAQRQLGPSAESSEGPLPSIARISREAVATMSDIVWAINPRRDTLSELVSRMRGHAEELFTLRDIELSFKAPEEERHVRLNVDLRRDLFLIFKEATRNAARHSGCSRVEIELSAEWSWVCLRISDDGTGFDSSAITEGNGLMSMRRRAEALGGKLEIESGPDRGTTITFTLNRRPSRPWQRS